MEESIKHTYRIAGMSCGGCATSVKNKLTAVPGVTTVHVDLAKKQAAITSSLALKVDMLQEALSDTGYTIAELRV